MGKIICTYDKTKIYDIEFLRSGNLTDSDINTLLDTKALTYSLVAAMYRFMGDKTPIDKILSSDWALGMVWKPKEHNEFYNVIKDCYYNLYRYKGERLDSMVLWWLTLNGFHYNK